MSMRVLLLARPLGVAAATAVFAVALMAPISASAISPTGPGGVPLPPTAPPVAKVAVASGIDPTVTTKAKSSKRHRLTIPRGVWVSAPKAKAVAKRESGNNCKAVSPGGSYRGKWQMGAWFWSAYGGKKFAARPDRATCTEQDKVAYKGWVASWWHPWGG